MDRTFIVSAGLDTDIAWLQDALAPMAQLLRVGQSLEELVDLIEVTGSQLVMVEVNFEEVSAQCALIEGLLEARPMVSVVAIGDGFDNHLVISAMRAGARDFLAYGLRSSEISGLVRRLCQRLPALPERPERGSITLILGGQADADAGFIAAQLADAVARRGESTLLVDLGVPSGEAQQALGLEAAFSFGDAVRNLRRMDGNLIDSAFSRSGANLRLLSHVEGDAGLSSHSSAELYLLLGIFRQNFDQVFINVCGLPESDALRTLMANSQRLYWYLEQSVACCRRSLELMRQLQGRGAEVSGATLLVDRYIANVAPDAKSLRDMFELAAVRTLPLEAEQRLTARNEGKPLVERAPRSALSKAIEELAASLLHKGGRRPAPVGVLGRLLGRLPA